MPLPICVQFGAHPLSLSQISSSGSRFHRIRTRWKIKGEREGEGAVEVASLSGEEPGVVFIHSELEKEAFFQVRIRVYVSRAEQDDNDARLGE